MAHYVRNTAQRGFTLLEISFVIVIIGLITAGITVGKDMIRSSEIRSVLTEVDRYKTAMGNFRSKYGALPGDLRNATAIWGFAGGTTGFDATCYNVSNPSATATCNGDGDGRIGWLQWGTDIKQEEWFMLWKHLANAGLISGSYTGTKGSGGTGNAVPGGNVPESRLSNGGYTMMHRGPLTTGNTEYFPGNYRNVIAFGAKDATLETKQPVLSGPEAYLLDEKQDDGEPGTGQIRGYRTAVSPSCTSSDDPEVADYLTTGAAPVCSLLFMTGF